MKSDVGNTMPVKAELKLKFKGLSGYLYSVTFYADIVTTYANVFISEGLEVVSYLCLC